MGTTAPLQTTSFVIQPGTESQNQIIKLNNITTLILLVSWNKQKNIKKALKKSEKFLRTVCRV